jgi:hypothetical protein
MQQVEVGPDCFARALRVEVFNQSNAEDAIGIPAEVLKRQNVVG